MRKLGASELKEYIEQNSWKEYAESERVLLEFSGYDSIQALDNTEHFEDLIKNRINRDNRCGFNVFGEVMVDNLVNGKVARTFDQVSASAVQNCLFTNSVSVKTPILENKIEQIRRTEQIRPFVGEEVQDEGYCLHEQDGNNGGKEHICSNSDTYYNSDFRDSDAIVSLSKNATQGYTRTVKRWIQTHHKRPADIRQQSGNAVQTLDLDAFLCSSPYWY